jgi:hypothetical protein
MKSGICCDYQHVAASARMTWKNLFSNAVTTLEAASHSPFLVAVTFVGFLAAFVFFGRYLSRRNDGGPDKKPDGDPNGQP